MAGMLASQLYWTARLKKLKAKAQRESADILICSQIRNAFAVGIFRPQIYLPAGCSAETRACILAHERAHIARHDNLWRLLTYTESSRGDAQAHALTVNLKTGGAADGRGAAVRAQSKNRHRLVE